jgi:hypothetical protein
MHSIQGKGSYYVQCENCSAVRFETVDFYLNEHQGQCNILI